MSVHVRLKLATSLDGRIATATGESRWITGPAAREEVHRLRAIHLNVLVGVDTVIADDPELTVRLAGYVGPQPRRIVFDSRQRIPQTAAMIATAARVPTIVVTTVGSNKRLTDAGVTVLEVVANEGRVDVDAALAALDGAGVRSILVEGGGQVAASFLNAGRVDAIEWFRAPILLGDEGRPVVGAFVLRDLAAAPRFRRISVEAVGDDLWERYERA
jgi:diaminohydroxyphosphoribosylaminopyrimidine deaminase/5-amino-6-(5-phosphoribosylamino)uracil reductase